MNKINHSFLGKDFISVEQLTEKKEIDLIFNLADKIRGQIEHKTFIPLAKRYCVCELFYQPSTRTFTSFLAAASYLGCQVVPIHGMQAYSSAVKGETLPDTIRTVVQTTACDLIVLRHPDNNSSRIAAQFAPVPIVNAGSGTHEHPTQAVLDLYTIKRHFTSVDGLTILFLGDLKYGRTVKSLAKLMSVYAKNLKFIFVSPKELVMPPLEIKNLEQKNIKIVQTQDLKKVLPLADILYVTRIQKEWFENENKIAEYNKLKGIYTVDKKLLKQARKNMIIMHPLPRVDEINYEVDADPRAKYFQQMRNGLYTRIALLRLILTGK